jgi:Ran GTPase-activating protein (RanGAP) involved in mRNA processing and transport
VLHRFELASDAVMDLASPLGGYKFLLDSYLPRLADLRTLILSENQLEDDFAMQFAELVEDETWRSLQRLELQGNVFTDEGATPLIQSLPCIERPGLTRLVLSMSSDMRAATAKALAAALAAMPQLPHLGLDGIGLTGRNAHIVAPAIGGLAALQLLDLCGAMWHELADADVAAIAPHLGKLACLTELQLSGRDIEAGGAAALAPQVCQLTALRILNLELNDFGPDSMEALAPALGALTSLRELRLGRNERGDRAAAALAVHLPALSALAHLSLYNNRISTEGWGKLEIALSHLTELSLVKEDGLGRRSA